MGNDYRTIATKLIHSGEPRPLIEGAVTLPIFQSSTFAYKGQQSYHDLKYIRLNNTPNHSALHTKLADLEQAEDAVVTGSGMAAIATTLLALLSTGDHFLAQGELYGGTLDFIRADLSRLGITVDYIDGNAPAAWEGQVKPQTRLIYAETITNPLMEVGDLEAMTAFARSHGLLAVIDNTFATPVNFRPLSVGFDLALHSGSKYLNGHSDIVAGAVMGRSELIRKVVRKLNHFGGVLDPHACFLLHRGLKTLAVRMAHHNRSAAAIAQFLAGHAAVSGVNYPGLRQHPQHQRARKLLDGFGGMLSFEIKGGVAAADRFISRLRLPISAPSLGGVESLVTRPATTSHSGVDPQMRRALGITDSLIRLSVGLEDTDELIADLESALAD